MSATCEICLQNFDSIQNLEFHVLKDHNCSSSEEGEKTNFTKATETENIESKNNNASTIPITKTEIIEEYDIAELSGPINDNSLVESKQYTVLSSGSPLNDTTVNNINEDNLVVFNSTSLLPEESATENIMKDKVLKLLEMLIDEETLKKLGWPYNSEEEVSD